MRAEICYRLGFFPHVRAEICYRLGFFPHVRAEICYRLAEGGDLFAPGVEMAVRKECVGRGLAMWIAWVAAEDCQRVGPEIGPKNW